MCINIIRPLFVALIRVAKETVKISSDLTPAK